MYVLVVTLMLTQNCRCEKTWRDAFRDIAYKNRPVIYPSYVAPVVPIIPVPQMPLQVDPPPPKMAPIPITLALAIPVDAIPAVEYHQSTLSVPESVPYSSS